MSSYESRLTGAGFLGDVDVSVASDGAVVVSGSRAPARLSIIRTVVQWVVLTIGLTGMFTGVQGAGLLVLAAPVFSFAAYLALWFYSADETVRIVPGETTRAGTGMALRWYDYVWLLNPLTALSMLVGVLSMGPRTVTFHGPSRTPSRDVRYLLVAKDAGDAAVLTLRLLGRSEPAVLSVEPAHRADAVS
jgi:hypothetical protein